MNTMSTAAWADRFEAIARLTLAGSSWESLLGAPTAEKVMWIGEFRDDAGHRRAVDRPFLAALLGVDAGTAGDSSASSLSIDARLWWAAHDPSTDVPELIALGTPSSGDALVAESDTLEVRTETELCAMHALWRLSKAREIAPGLRDELRERTLRAARWAVRELQPDNATNHPWAAHVFIELARREASVGARMYAETLVHNSMVATGKPDTFSALVLLDASRELRFSSEQGQ